MPSLPRRPLQGVAPQWLLARRRRGLARPQARPQGQRADRGRARHRRRRLRRIDHDNETDLFFLRDLRQRRDLDDRERLAADDQAAYLGNEADGAELMRPLADLGPEMNTFAMVPPNALGYLAMDPDAPMPYAGSSRMISDVSAAGID